VSQLAGHASYVMYKIQTVSVCHVRR